MNCIEFKSGDYVAVMNPDGRIRAYGTVRQVTYFGYWVEFPDGSTAGLIPFERLRHAVKEDPDEPVAVPKDKVTAAKEEYDRLLQEQKEVDRRRSELGSREADIERELDLVAKSRTELTHQSWETSKRLGKLRSFLDFADTI